MTDARLIKQGQERRQQILSYIKAYIKEHGYAPTIREIMDGIGLRSRSSAQKHLNRMVKEGTLELDPNKGKRAIRIPENKA